MPYVVAIEKVCAAKDATQWRAGLCPRLGSVRPDMFSGRYTRGMQKEAGLQYKASKLFEPETPQFLH